MVPDIMFPEDIVEENEDELPDQVVENALMLLDVWDPSAYGKAPSGVAATAIYVADMAGEGELTQDRVCEVIGSSPMTIRKQQADAAEKGREADIF